jgi:hypothetical protein
MNLSVRLRCERVEPETLFARLRLLSVSWLTWLASDREAVAADLRRPSSRRARLETLSDGSSGASGSLILPDLLGLDLCEASLGACEIWLGWRDGGAGSCNC